MPHAPRRRRSSGSVPSRPRDAQRKRCYVAEWSVQGTGQLDGVEFIAVGDMQAYVDTLVPARWFQHLCGAPPGPALRSVRVGAGSGSHRARATFDLDSGAHVIQMPRAMRREAVLLHELAHVATTHRYGWERIAGHGWQWAAAYLSLVRGQLGFHAGEALLTAFERQGVQVEPPVKPDVPSGMFVV